MEVKIPSGDAYAGDRFNRNAITPVTALKHLVVLNSVIDKKGEQFIPERANSEVDHSFGFSSRGRCSPHQSDGEDWIGADERSERPRITPIECGFVTSDEAVTDPKAYRPVAKTE